MMRRTNIYLNDDQLVFLKNMALQEHRTVAELVRQAVDSWLADKLPKRDRWSEQLDDAVTRLRSRLPADVPEDEIEADITAAMDEVKAARKHHAPIRRFEAAADAITDADKKKETRARRR
jgi:hypothetical protein